MVRFGESDGYERNFARENAWHYRDWVIAAFNADLSYDEFVRMQLIGDQLTDRPEGLAATGFWVAGVHNTVVGGSRRMQLLARQEEIEEVLGTLGQTFVGLTFNCARCHDHKFDPISQLEYYRLSSSISGLGFGERDVVDPAEQARLDELNLEYARLESELASIDGEARDRALANRGVNQVVEGLAAPAALSLWEFDQDLGDSVGSLHGTAQGTARLENGALVLDGAGFVETAPLALEIKEKTLEVWVQLENLEQQGGAAMSLDSLEGGTFDALVFAELESRRWMPGSDFFRRTESFQGSSESEAMYRPVHLALVYRADGTITAFRDGQPYGRTVRKADGLTFAANSARLLFGLRHKPGGDNRFLKAKIHRAAFYDRALESDEVVASAARFKDYVAEEALIAVLDAPAKARRDSIKARLKELADQREVQAKRVSSRMHTLIAGQGETTNFLLRGDPETIGEVVTPGAPAAIAELEFEFGLAADAPEAERRRKLAGWLTHPANPLFSRVMVNRIWHHHFGVGIVDTPSDFGFNGGRPSHPELLDYLALRFQRNGFRMKDLHRLIVKSAAYRQATDGLPEAEWQRAHAQDASNRLLWRGVMRRLDAETLRDAMLQTAGKLNLELGGPGFKDVSVTFNNATTFYEPLDVDGPEFFRRTVYRFNPRGERSALLETFDCPDPSVTTPLRSSTTTPLQSLSLMNNALVLRLADDFAERVRREAGDQVPDQVRRAWQLAIARDPNQRESQLSEELVEQHGLSALCRGLFNFNEFVWVQ